jgi:hypothetical protein
MISKKSLTSGVLALVLAMSVTNARPQPAQALVGGLMGGALPVMLVGGAMVFAGIAVAVGTGVSSGDTNGNGFVAIGGMVALVGLIVLDSGGAPTLKYQPIDSTTAHAWGLNDDEHFAYNSNIDEFNAAAEGDIADMVASNTFTAEASRAGWERHGSGFDAVTRSGLGKVSAHVMEQMKQRRG